ncbi:AAA family ATPase [Chryseobacterium sp. KLBC 52]|uniref:AAA family ATPase n=1 Tax=Chryseobacterium sp. KLBC 52 TaxID=1862702 RepID=UPI000E0BF7C2|nr:AAA family ATPase [Chryseobacterium sp. KLBC 52]
MDLLKGSAIIAFVVGFWDKIKTFLWMILSTFIQKAEIKNDDTHNEVIGYLIKNYKKARSYDKVYGAQYESFRNGKYGYVPYEKFGDNLMIFFSQKKYFFKLIRVPFLFTKNSVTFLSNDSNPSAHSETEKTVSYIISIRGSINVSEIVEKAIHSRNNISWNIEETEEKANRFNIYYFPEREHNGQDRGYAGYNGYSWYRQNNYKLLGVTQDELGRELKNNGKALDNLFFPDDVKELISIIGLWVKSKNWYKEKSIPWKRGWLLYGPPGTGKTALARAFAEDLDLPIHFFSLAQMSNNDLIKSWQSMQLNIPCIALIEDIDNVFNKRKNIAQSSNQLLVGSFSSQNNSSNHSGNESNNDQQNEIRTPLTFDTLLNCIDGVDKSDGIFTIITTNDITKIDEAIGQPKTLEDGTQVFISSRPGRIDRAIELTYMSSENKIKMADKILSDFPDKLLEIYEHIKKNEKETPAQFQEYCAQIALQEYWKINE